MRRGRGRRGDNRSAGLVLRCQYGSRCTDTILRRCCLVWVCRTAGSSSSSGICRNSNALNRSFLSLSRLLCLFPARWPSSHRTVLPAPSLLSATAKAPLLLAKRLTDRSRWLCTAHPGARAGGRADDGRAIQGETRHARGCSGRSRRGCVPNSGGAPASVAVSIAAH